MSTDEPMRPRKAIKRSAPPRRRNPARRNREWLRAYGSDERVAFVRSLPCVAGSTFCDAARDNVHIATGGMGRKADADRIVSMCRYHHRLLHSEGPVWFESAYHVDLAALAAETEWAFRAFCGDEPPVEPA